MKGPIRVNKDHPGSELLKWFKLGVIQKMDVYILLVYRCSVGGLVSRAGHFSYSRFHCVLCAVFGSYAIGSHVA